MDELAPHLITAIMLTYFLCLFSCSPNVSLLFLIPCSNAFEGLLLHPRSTATGSITARLPSNNNVIKTKLRQ